MFFFFFLFLFYRAVKQPKSPFPVSDIKHAAPSEMQRSCLMSSEAGAAFPLNRLSVFDLCPLSPTNKAANTLAAAARRCEWLRFTRGPLTQALRLHQQLSQAYTRSPLNHPCHSTRAHRKSDSYPFILPFYVNPKHLRLPRELCENTRKKYLQMVCVFAG